MYTIKTLATLLLVVLLTGHALAQRVDPFHVTVSGKGKQAVVLIPGFSCSGTVWDETVRTLAPNHTCYTITFPGFADQQAQSNPDMQQWMADVANYIREQHIDKPIVIGHSLGGVMALMLGSAHPNLVSRILVVDALPSLSAFFDTTFKPNSNPDCSMFGKQFMGMSVPQFYSMQQQGVKTLVAHTAMQSTIVGWAMQSDRNTLGLIYCQFLNTDMRGKLSTIKCPTLVLLEPSFQSYDYRMKQQYAGLPSLTLKYASKGLHFIMYDDKAWYMNEVKQFCL